ncbi:sugar ABC transporter permease [Microlunatus elymi]|uniref:Sugar ABC transporter permease n=1 Tax=Microlunatus elymi TaxID=2596828 RepID=A0A516Q0J1_9ACTN|nr:sugar ABC transporter permease [Microlunatus elymi]QDP96721.1 sugar ABC transporter permease [Microlunatus elymi]
MVTQAPDQSAAVGRGRGAAQRKGTSPRAGSGHAHARGAQWKKVYPLWFYIVPGVIYLAIFIVPTFASFFFSLTRWTLSSWEFIGFDNFVSFFQEPSLSRGLVNTIIYAFLTSGAKVVIGLLLAVLLTTNLVGKTFLRSVVFFPVLVSTVGVGITFKALMNPEDGLINQVLGWFGVSGPGWLTSPDLALFSIIIVDIWKGLGIATLIYIAGIVSIPAEYYEAAKVDGAGAWSRFRHLILPLSRPATATVIILSLIGGLRSFELIWSMTGGGPGYTSDVLASVIYKQYQAGFFGLSTAGNVVLFVLVAVIAIPLNYFLTRRQVEI